MTALTDQFERTKALDTTLSFIVQAPAGSGKTELLIQRYLALLSQSPTPESVVAITFTRKAASEIKERVLQALRFAQQPLEGLSEPQKTRAKLANQLYHWQLKKQWDLLQQPHRLHVQTIDAFYAELIRKASFHTALQSSFPIADHPETLYKVAIHHLLSYLEDNLQLGSAIAQLARHLNNDMLQIERLLIYMLAHRDQWIEIIALGNKGPNQLRSVLEKSLQLLRAENYQKVKMQLTQYGDSHWLVTLQNWLRFHSADDTHVLDPNNDTFWQLVVEQFMTQQGQWRRKIHAKHNILKTLVGLQKKEYQQCKEKMQDLLNAFKVHQTLRVQLWALKQLPPAHYSQTQWSLLKDLFHILSALLQILEFTFQEYKKTDYIAVELKALDILGTDEDPTETLLKYDAYIQHILIDEFQDTSVAQLQFLKKLTAGWQLHDGRTLFLVGDPMQSIYQFRNAEPRVFQFVQTHGVGNCPLHLLTLSSNFRATAPLVKWINHHFDAINKNLALQYNQSNTFTPSVAVSSTAVFDHGIITHWFEDISLLQEAKHIVILIKKLLKENEAIESSSKSPKIAILGRSRQHLRTILAQLKLTDIAYQAIEIETVFEQPIIQDLLALVRALAHLGDDIAWLALLRAPWCGISLNSLHELTQACRSTQPAQVIWEQLQNLEKLPLNSADKIRCDRLVKTLAPIIACYGRVPLYQLVKKAWIHLGGPATYNIYPQTAKDIDTFFQCLNQVQVGETLVDHTLLERSLQTRYIQTIYDDSCANVLLMTIHKAKGLEFDIVILPSLHRSVRNQNYPLILFDEQTIQNKNCLIMAPIKSNGTFTQSAIYDYLWYMKSQAYQMESVRLFYVACTRAKHEIHLIGGGLSRNAKETILPPTGSLLYWLWPVLAPSQVIISAKDMQSDIPTVFPSLLRKMTLSSDYPKVPSMGSLLINHRAHFPLSFEYLSSQHLLNKIILRLLDALAERALSSEQLFKEINRLKEYAPLVKELLQKFGYSKEFNGIFEKVTHMLRQILSSTRGRWILMSTHFYHRHHYEFYQLQKDQMSLQLIHRLLIDQYNCAWVIDYCFEDSLQPQKSLSLSKPCSLQSYQVLLKKALAFHQLQYGKLSYQSLRIGLYWPYHDQWLEGSISLDKI